MNVSSLIRKAKHQLFMITYQKVDNFVNFSKQKITNITRSTTNQSISRVMIQKLYQNLAATSLYTIHRSICIQKTMYMIQNDDIHLKNFSKNGNFDKESLISWNPFAELYPPTADPPEYLQANVECFIPYSKPFLCSWLSPNF